MTQMFGDEFRYCEYYNHCRKIPCRDPDTNFQKNHDFNLNLVVDPERKYLIQYRHPLEAVSSWFEYELKNLNPWQRLWMRDNSASWNSFLQKKLKYWRGFVSKWVIPARNADTSPENVLLLDYHAFVRSPREKLRQIGQFVSPSNPPTAEKIDWVLKIQTIEQRRQLGEFKYFDENEFSRQENDLQSLLTAAGLDACFRNDSDGKK